VFSSVCRRTVIYGTPERTAVKFEPRQPDHETHGMSWDASASAVRTSDPTPILSRRILLSSRGQSLSHVPVDTKQHSSMRCLCPTQVLWLMVTGTYDHSPSLTAPCR